MSNCLVSLFGEYQFYLKNIFRFPIFVIYNFYLTNIFRKLQILSNKYFSYLRFSGEYIKASSLSRQRMANFLNTNFVKELHPTSSKNSKTLDTYVNVIDDFKTNLMWLSIFVQGQKNYPRFCVHARWRHFSEQPHQDCILCWFFNDDK
jgi:hypothetical protein